MVSLFDLLAGPLVQLRRTNDSEAVTPAAVVNIFGSKERELTWVYVEPRLLVTSIPLKIAVFAVIVLQPNRPDDQVRALEAELHEARPEPYSWEELEYPLASKLIETDALPTTFRETAGEEVPIPTLLLVAST